MPDELVTTKAAHVVHWAARDRPGGVIFRGSFEVVTNDLGGTIGVAVYRESNEPPIHCFYAHTKHADFAVEIARELIEGTVRELAAQGARFVFAHFPERFPHHVFEHGHDTLEADVFRDGHNPLPLFGD